MDGRMDRLINQWMNVFANIQWVNLLISNCIPKHIFV